MAECQRCQFQPVVQALSSLVQTFPRREEANGKVVVKYLNRAELTYREANDRRVSKTAKAIIEPFSRLVDYINDDLLPLAREVCKECSRASDDNNLTSRGRVMVSLDAMPNGVTPSTRPGQDGSGSWLDRNTIYTPPSSGGVTALPTHIEDMMRKVIHDFAELDVFDQNLIFHQLSGGTMTDFATMKWVPHEMKRAQSKEFADYRWKRLVTRFPIAAALRKAKPLISRSKRVSKGEVVPMVQEELDLFHNIGFQK